MTGQLCGGCGEPIAPEGCACGRLGGLDEETAVIPVVGGPELVRPYFQPLDGQAPRTGPADAGQSTGQATGQPAPEPGFGDAPFAGEAFRTEVLDLRAPAEGQPPEPVEPARTFAAPPTRQMPVYLPEQQSTAPLGGLVVTRPAEDARGGRRRRGRPSRSTVLIGAGIAVIAGIGVAAALVPRMLDGGPVTVALPQPGVTAPLPSGTTDSGLPSATPSALPTHAAPIVRTTHPAPRSSTPTTPVSSSRPTPPPTSAPPSASPTPTTASPTPSPSDTSGADSGTLSMGDTGPAVVTLQQDLSSIWGLDQNLQADGVYGRRTAEDVATFQNWFGVQGDPPGVYGPNTQAAMAQELATQNGQ
ncbi:peptidoglycan-binding protein [Streptacidiphilus sp. 4-A2]|nr:peptidoglycan-binding protein [Streptacidiphilus sp. 4-A2]